MNRTKIEYLDYTLNLFVGCNGVDCAVRPHCWAMAMAKRQRCELCKRFVPHYHSERWSELFQKGGKGYRIGLNFMSDTFDRDVVHHLCFNEMMVMIEKCFWHTFIVLTKQPQNIPFNRVWPKNLWLGITVNRWKDVWRIEELKNRFGGKVRIVSFEPLLEPMFEGLNPDGSGHLLSLRGFDWVIIGAQTRPNVQPESRWVQDLINEARRIGAAVFLKNNLSDKIIHDVADDLCQEFPK